MNRTIIAVDLAKNVFELAVSQEPGKISERHRLSRQGFLAFFAPRPRATVVMEACGTCHHWARRLIELGHEVVLLPAHHVRPYVKNRKTDRTDAAGILEAYRCAQIVPVPVKTLAQQGIAALHRIRSTWMETRTARLNALRGLLREYGIFIPLGAKKVLPVVSLVCHDADAPIPPSLRPILHALALELCELDRRVEELKGQLEAIAEETPVIQLLLSIPGIGLLTATALYTAIGDPNRFPSGRHLASFLGLTPRERSSGNRRHLGAIHKHGDSYLRTLLTHCARSLLITKAPAGQPDPLRTWAQELANRRGFNVATVALANRLTRIAWAVWARQTEFSRA